MYGGNYMESLLALVEAVELKNGVHHIHIKHDSWCQLLAEKGPCNCTPELTLDEGGRA